MISNLSLLKPTCVEEVAVRHPSSWNSLARSGVMPALPDFGLSSSRAAVRSLRLLRSHHVISRDFIEVCSLEK